MTDKKETKRFVVGIDLGGTKIEACLLDSDRMVLKRHRIPSQADRGLDRVLDNIESLLQTVADGYTFEAVGLGTPATYIETEDRLYGAPHTPAYEIQGFVGKLRERLPVPLIVENDANCLALAEYFAGCEGEFSHVMAVILGTGVGSGLILDRRLYRGSDGGAGEIGHMSIDIDGRLCECGRRGCAEAYLSGPSHSRRFFDLTGRRLDLKAIFRLFMEGDSQAVSLIEESCWMMGEVFANVINILDLQAIILGGGVSNLPVWYEKVPGYMDRALFGIPRDTIPLIKARLGDSAGVFGAAYLALREIGLMKF
ncbi:ROK family protein [Acidobacteriota bacterium]